MDSSQNTVQQFHQDLLGRQPTETQAAFYSKGFRWSNQVGADQTVASIVLALWQSRQGGPVYFIVEEDHKPELMEHIQMVFRHCIRLRKTNPEAVQALLAAFKQIQVGSRVFTVEEPPCWVALGFKGQKVPDWFSRKI